MKKTVVKVVTVAIALCMLLLCLSGCGESKGTADTLVLGGIGPVTGAAASYGTSVRNGAQLAVDEINKAGGVNGMKLELKFEDDEADAEKAVNAYNTLKDNGMKVLIGTVTSGACKAVKDNTHEDNLFQLTPSGSAVECTKYDNAFRICFSDPSQGTASAQYIVQKQLASKVAVIYNSSDVYSSGIYEKFAAEAKVQNLEIVTTQAFTDDTKTDFSVALQKVKESGAELVFLPIYYQEAALILQQAKTAGLTTKFFGCDGLDGVISQLGEDVALAEGVMLLTPFVANATDEKTVAFVNAYKTAYDAVPDQFAADAYDAVYTVKAALEKANVTDANMDVSELCDLLKVAMTQITVEGVTGTMTWDAAGDTSKTPKGMEIVNGEYKAMD